MEFVYPKDFKFTEGDILEIYKKEKKSSSVKSEVLYAQYIHSENPEDDLTNPEPVEPAPEESEEQENELQKNTYW